MDQRIPLTLIPTLYRETFGEQCPAAVSQIRNWGGDGLLHELGCQRGENGRWSVLRSRAPRMKRLLTALVQRSDDRRRHIYRPLDAGVAA